MDKLLRYFSIARKAGLLELGEEDTGAAVRGGKAKAVFLAADASDNALHRAQGFVHGRDVPLLRIDRKKEDISAVTGKGGCSMAAVTDIGLADSMLAVLAQENPERYAEAAAQLAARHAKADRRRAEARAHEKNKKIGKRRTAI